ncbi:LPS export ABC transporter permease LptG [Wenxinia saemankumensis]|uniref:Lipopolysaccharide export system permease protein n=1 Tax=Wenxinia saemankumensis TaxID=1447782 RepID=A0A1M6HHD0_9RHOB|nr:LPS export ABC transporter permease LptG [Wenxinia saemankumensis]SHJ21572.1 lipopolysaccharide export system permease protein [Wenxinia saemankumensis]
MILHRYYARRFAATFLGVFAVFLAILLFVDLIEQARRFGGEGVGLAGLLRLSALSIPRELFRILPLVTIIATLVLFLSLARSSELVVTRAAGRPALAVLAAPALVMLLIGAAAVAAMDPIVAATSREYERRVDALQGRGEALGLGADGIWLRQGGMPGPTIINAARTNVDGTALWDTTFLTFDGEGTPLRRIAARRAILGAGEWTLYDAKVWPLQDGAVPEAAAREVALFTLPSPLTPAEIRDSFGDPSEIPVWELPAFIARLNEAGFTARRHEVWLQMQLALPVFLAAMVLIGAAFTMRHHRSGRTGLMVLLALLVSFGVYFLRSFAQILGENGDIPPALAAWAPPLAAALLTLGLILHLEDG